MSFLIHNPAVRKGACLPYSNCTTCNILALDKQGYRICISMKSSGPIPPTSRLDHKRKSRLTLALAYPSLIVIFLTSSFLNRTVCTPEMALTTVLYQNHHISSSYYTFRNLVYLPMGYMTNSSLFEYMSL